MTTHPVQTTVPADVAEAIERLAKEQMLSKAAVVRLLLVKRLREETAKPQEVPL